MKAFEFKPKLFLALKNYSKELFMADLMAGIIVGIVALPLAIAFGIASGVSPEKGIITAIIAGFIISMMGGSTGLTNPVETENKRIPVPEQVEQEPEKRGFWSRFFRPYD